MLRGQTGTDKFWAGIRDYYRQYRDGNASSADFRRVMEENSGQALGWFFEQWLQRTPSPAIEGGWQYNSSSGKVVIDLAQTQKGDAYRLPLEIGIDGRVKKVEMTQKHQHFEFAAERAPESVILDPNTWVLMDARFTKK